MAERLWTKEYVFLDSSGNPRAGGLVRSKDSLTSALRNTYSNNGLTVQNLNPITLNSSGRLPVDVFLSPVDYNFTVTNSDGTDSITIDPSHGIQDLAASPFTASLTGSIATTVYLRLNTAPVNAKTDFGATGDGSTDDYAALQAAASACVGGSQRELYIPTGTYMLGHQLNLSNISVFGAGAIATTFRAKASFPDASIILIDDTTGGSGGVDSIYQNFRIYGDRANQSTAVIGMLVKGNVLGNVFQKIRIQECKGTALKFDGKAGPVRPSLITGINIRVADCDSHGIEIAAGRNMTFLEPWIEQIGGTAIYVTGATEACSKLSFQRPWIEVVAGDGIYFGEVDQSEVVTPNVSGYGATATASYGFRNAGSGAIRNKLVGGDFSKNASPHASSKHIYMDGGDRLELDHVDVADANFSINGNRGVIVSNRQLGSQSTMPLLFSNGRGNISASTYLAPYTGAQSTTYSDVRQFSPGYMSLSQLRFETTVNAGGSATYTATVHVDGSSTVLTATTAAGGGTGSNYVNEVLVGPGSTIALNINPAGGAAVIPLDGIHCSVGVRLP